MYYLSNQNPPCVHYIHNMDTCWQEAHKCGMHCKDCTVNICHVVTHDNISRKQHVSMHGVCQMITLFPMASGNRCYHGMQFRFDVQCIFYIDKNFVNILTLFSRIRQVKRIYWWWRQNMKRSINKVKINLHMVDHL